MAEIKIPRLLLYYFSFRHLLYVALLLAVTPFILSQKSQPERTGKKKIELIYADDDYIVKDKKTWQEMHRFIGKVHLKHDEIIMWCDSAHYTPSLNQVIAFSKIHIQQGDTINLYGNYLFYDGKSEVALVKDNVELVNKETHLYTEAIDYDVKRRIARYNTGGRIINAKNTLTSIIGVYFVSDNLFHFKDSVKIVNPNYVMRADTMDYNSKTETSLFTGPTELKGDSINLYSEKGWYDTKNDITSVWKKAMIDNRQQIIHGDSLYFNNKTGYGEAYRNVIIEDTTNSLVIEGNFAWYTKRPEAFLITDRAVFVQVSKNDSLFLHGDTISAVTVFDSTLTGHRLMKAYHGCRIFSKGLQAKCDSLSYSFRDSVIRLYTSPVIWSDENQLTSDSMAVFTKNRQTERLELYSNAFVTSQIDTVRFNQIKGRTLTGLFKNNELYKIDIRGNGESIYYLVEGIEISGVNQTKSARIEILVNNGKISDISEFQDPEGFIDPPDLKKQKEGRLAGFIWLDNLRPKQKSDIFRK